ncbi:MAG: acetyl-CoA hydrolase/transferase C-terminal domain-containing protein [Syntrophomonadaceae bacterium]|nr:acetyl-CoA hydrolase/transferase C-terminal domain-containing protein [Syntrophomonadaceae bacterium]
MHTYRQSSNARLDSWQDDYRKKICSAEQAASLIMDHDVISMAGGSSIPRGFAEALGRRVKDLHDVTLLQGFTLSPFEFMQAEFKDNIHIETAFVGPTERACIQDGLATYVPVHLHNIGEWLYRRQPNITAHAVTPPDEQGYMNRSCYAGLSHRKAFEAAATVIAEVNPNLPWLCGEDLKVHVSEVDYIIENPFALEEVKDIAITENETMIAHYIAEMIPDGSTIQLGLGGLANAVGHFLKDKKDLGLHTEVISNSAAELMKLGVINGARKSFHPRKTLGCFCVGDKTLWEFVDHNEDFCFYEIDFINDPQVIAQNHNLVSVNNTLMMDLTGQAASESIGTYQYSGTGGQGDFVRGASISPGGKSILALNSCFVDRAGQRHSRIVPLLPAGTVVSTPRTDVEYVVTEYGVAALRWQSITQRVKLLINIAHPDYREELKHQAQKLGWI